jgi:hypothetical protein
MMLFCIFASNISVQDMAVTGNDKCHRYSVYDADGAIYGTAKLISLVAKNDAREPVEAGESEAAPGIEYLNNATDPAAYFARLVSSTESQETDEDVQFVGPTEVGTGSQEEDFGLGATVDISKDFSGENVDGGGAEFGNTYGGAATQLIRTRFRIEANTTNVSRCSDTNVRIQGDYWIIVTEAGQTKGI